MKIIHISNLTGEVEDKEVTWRPSVNKSLLDQSNRSFLRTIQLTEQGLFIIKGKEVAGFPLNEFIKLVVNQCPTLTWAPQVKVEVVDGVATAKVNSETAYSVTWQVFNGEKWDDTLDTGDSYTPSGVLSFGFRAKATNATGSGVSNVSQFTPSSSYQVT